MAGTVVTFYSYKGGVGRSFALANIAVLLGQWGFRVLCIDWDLEAPGLPHYFNSLDRDDPPTPLVDDSVSGLIESFSDFQLDPKIQLTWNDRIISLPSALISGVSLLKAGIMDPSYSKRVHRLDWEELYRSGLGEALEEQFETLRQEYDYILIDARTGVADFSGIINSQLPDIMAFLFTSNEQSFEGATAVARKAVLERDSLPLDRSRLFLLPIAARFEIQLEHKLSVSWQKRFSKELGDCYEAWTTPRTNYEQLCQLTTIPYVPIWSFGERLAVVEDTSRDPLSINYSLETIAALLAHRLDHTLLLLDSRDEFVSSAQRIAAKHDQTNYSVFLSYSHEDSEVVRELSARLEQVGLRIVRPQLRQEGTAGTELQEHLNRAMHMIVVLNSSGKQSRQQEHETRTFLRQAALDDRTRLLIPIALHDVDAMSVPTYLRSYKIVELSGDYDVTMNEVVKLIRSTVTTVSSDDAGLRVHATTDGDIPIEAVCLCALASNDTTITAMTDRAGRAALKLLAGRQYRLLIAHPQYASRVVEVANADGDIRIRMAISRDVGSVIMHATGYIPGLSGRLNPILDTSKRMYLYADNIAVNGGQGQPATFEVDRPFKLEDAQGAIFEVTVKLISGRTTLLEYRKLA